MRFEDTSEEDELNVVEGAESTESDSGGGRLVWQRFYPDNSGNSGSRSRSRKK